MINKLYDFFKNNFIDSNNTIIASLNINKKDIVVEDKRLIDTSLALIVACKNNDKEVIKRLVEGVDKFRDTENGGFFEITDRFGAVYSEGTIKHVINQIIANYALLLADREGPSSNINYKKRIEQLFSCYFENKSEIFLKNWEPVNSELTLTTVAFSCLLSIFLKCDTNIKDKLWGRCEQFYINKRYYSCLLNGRISKLCGTKLIDLALVLWVISLKKNYLLYSRADDLINFIFNYYRINLNGGLWNKVGSDPRKLVDESTSYLIKNESPFPYKDVMSHIVLEHVLDKFPKNSHSRELIKLTQKTLYRFYDKRNEGFFIGQGFWFANPYQPSVPLDRHVLVPAHELGSFAVGNTNYVPFQEKLAIVQEMGLLLLNLDNFPRFDVTLSKFNYSKRSVYKKIEYVSKDDLQSSLIDVKKYEHWLRKTESGYGYGLTPYRSPLSMKSDKTPQNFSALHVVSDLTVLHLHVENSSSLKKALEVCQNDDGGFGEQPSLLSEVFTTYCVVAALFILKSNNFDKQKCIDFLSRCQNDDGSFGNAPGYPGDAWHTHLAVLALHLLDGESNYDTNACIQYLLNCQNNDGGFALVPGNKSETYSTFRCVDSLIVQGVIVPNREKIVSWIQDRQDNNGGFHFGFKEPISFVGSYHAIAALYILGKLPVKLYECKKWISKHQTLDGGFGNDKFRPSLTTDEGFVILQSSYMLEKKLNPYWVEIIT